MKLMSNQQVALLAAAIRVPEGLDVRPIARHYLTWLTENGPRSVDVREEWAKNENVRKDIEALGLSPEDLKPGGTA